MHEGVVSVTARNGGKAGVCKDMGGVQECTAQPIANEVLWVEGILPICNTVLFLYIPLQPLS